MPKQTDPIVLYYVPSEPGEGFSDIPKRDLTQRDLDRMDGAQLRNATSPHPNGKPALYQTSKPSGNRGKTADEIKTAGSAPAETDDTKG